MEGNAVATAPLTTTSYAILGLLALKPWTTYELTQQMDRSLGRYWPRAQSKLYEEPKKLVVHGLARATDDPVGQRSRTVYTITAKGRRALAGWLEDPGAGPVIEFEQLVKVFFSDQGTRAGTLATLDAGPGVGPGTERRDGRGGSRLPGGPRPVPGPSGAAERQRALPDRLLRARQRLGRVGPGRVVETWPDDPSEAEVDPAVVEENQRRAESVAGAVIPGLTLDRHTPRWTLSAGHETIRAWATTTSWRRSSG